MLTPMEIFWAFQIGGLAYVISCVLMAEKALLEPYLDLLLNLEAKGRLGAWLARPLGLCEKCLAGQLGLWLWFLHGNYAVADLLVEILRHGLFITFSIISVSLFKKYIS